MRDTYYKWMLDKIGGPLRNERSYKKLLSCLYTTEYIFILPMDGNRYEDGIDLRYRFAYETGISQVNAAEVDSRPCSIFEMLLGIALRIEDEIMSDPEYGDRTDVWFWDFLNNLGLTKADDMNYDDNYVSSVLNNFLNRNYDLDGTGSIVRISDVTKNCASAELWMQVMWYLSEKA